MPETQLEPIQILVSDDSITVVTTGADNLAEALFITAITAIRALEELGIDSTLEAITESLEVPSDREIDVIHK